MREATFETSDWQEWFCEKGGPEWRQKPFVAAGMRIGTDGIVMVACESCEPATEFNDEDRRRINMAVGIASATTSETESVSRDELADWAGPVEYATKNTCPECEGTMKIKHECDCDYCDVEFEDDPCGCDGTAVTTPKARLGRIFDLVFNRNLVALVLDKAPPCATVRVWKTKSKLLYIQGDGWRAAIACMLEEGKDAPEFELYRQRAKARGM